MISTSFSWCSTRLAGRMVISVPTGRGVKEKEARVIGAKRNSSFASVEQAGLHARMQGCKEAARFSTKPAGLSLKGHTVTGVPFPTNSTDNDSESPEFRRSGPEQKTLR